MNLYEEWLLVVVPSFTVTLELLTSPLLTLGNFEMSILPLLS